MWNTKSDGGKGKGKKMEDFKQGSSEDKILKKRGYTLSRMLGEGAYARVSRVSRLLYPKQHH
jgi:hypothetical protein